VATPYRVILMTTPKGRKAEALAKALVTERLAACVNIVPGAVSYYRWQGKLCRDAECLLVAKTSAAKLPALERWVASHHPYTVPEVLALKVEAGSRLYLRWLADALR
jgi:periplasmic divalent cation tolerance protein